MVDARNAIFAKCRLGMKEKCEALGYEDMQRLCRVHRQLLRRVLTPLAYVEGCSKFKRKQSTRANTADREPHSR